MKPVRAEKHGRRRARALTHQQRGRAKRSGRDSRLGGALQLRLDAAVCAGRQEARGLGFFLNRIREPT